ncbi:erythromycin esterase family protein [Pullulanibacillus sp. KACC 23026]|uniref:erythromycin esterase family protein n=1 Tax=Pullulanibacillus sp. KACC 23026 TaxID=3028315 RepID=UPI0023AFA5D4|nr:erythromycin esterase family protein [Pullulanibacillus sp. KACC 23026]WEG10826.1 erythromycin esterase family protein [Pullulanibacillus sp. KACC 23026]
MTRTITKETVIHRIKERALPLDQTNRYDPLMERILDSKLVLLGEASHGTSEYYTHRAEITKRLIQEKDFRFIAVEGDWPACYKVNQYIKGLADTPDSAKQVLESFDHWPTWMWANEEIIPLIEWLKDYNRDRPDDKKIGFYGLDLYSLWESMELILNYLDRIGSRDIEKAKTALTCFHPHDRSVEKYGVHASFFSEDCIEEVVDLLLTVQKNKHFYTDDLEEALSLEMNARVAVDAESFYRAMVRGGSESWNIRDRHMTDTLIALMNHHGPDAKGIVWEHNTHVGDARATTMVDEGEINVGQLVREHFGDDPIFIVGFGSYQGSVIASGSWGDPFKVIDVPPAAEESWEYLFHAANPSDQLLLIPSNDPTFHFIKGHRAIGVVYEPQYELFGNYVATNLAKRYNAFVFIDKSHALHPLEQSKVVM